MIKAVIFDLDGTTISTLEDIQNSLNIVLKNNNYPIKNLEEVRLAVGTGSRNLIRKSLPSDSTDETIDLILKEYVDTYSKNYLIKSQAYPGIKELLKELNSLNIKIAINTNKPDSISKDLINKIFPKINFIDIVGQKENQPRKPDPYATNQIIKKMKLNIDEVVYVGDSETDIQTAKNANIKSIGCLWGFRDLQTLKQAEADFIVSEPKEILQIIGETK